MLDKVLLVVFCCWCRSKVQAIEQSPRIIIVGAGASGIAAASKLFQNGFNNITILEAENRIGGRVYTEKFGDYWVDIGGQWVHGEEDNVAFELAWPLGLLAHTNTPMTMKFLSSSGPTLPDDTGNELIEFYFNVTSEGIPDEYFNTSLGEYYTLTFDDYFNEHPEISADLRKPLKKMLDLFEMGQYAAPTWFDVSVNQEYVECAGDQGITWKERGYGTILDILMKKYPNPEEELPVLNNTVLNTEVARINYNISSGSVHVITSRGYEYVADHVIVTPSVGVLKADYKTLFNPPLPKAKVNAIENIELGHVVKIYLLYSEPWWIDPHRNVSDYYFFGFHWTEADRTEYANDLEKSWMLSIVTVTIVEHKSRLLCFWLTGPLARKVEKIPSSLVLEQLKQFLHRFMGKDYIITQPVAMLRSNWFTNKNFRGTWSYRSLKTERSGVKAVDLENPIMTKTGEPLVQFAGEATHSIHPSTVNGAIDSGWREAKRLTQLYAGRSFLADASQVGKEFWEAFEEGNPVVTRRLVFGSWKSAVARQRKFENTRNL